MKKTVAFFLLLATINLLSDDTYRLTYSSDTNCTLTKNTQEIPLFDPRFKKKEPKSSYTCSAIQKEQYNDCQIIDKKNITAEFFGYGLYEYTNFLIAFKNPHPSVKSFIEIKCTKSLPKK